jgi:hypothetical protein
MRPTSTCQVLWMNKIVSFGATNNPRKLHQRPLHNTKMTAWCAVSYGGIISPYFFEVKVGRTVNRQRWAVHGHSGKYLCETAEVSVVPTTQSNCSLGTDFHGSFQGDISRPRGYCVNVRSVVLPLFPSDTILCRFWPATCWPLSTHPSPLLSTDFPCGPLSLPSCSYISGCSRLVDQSAATCSRWFLARGIFYPEDGGDTFLRKVGSHNIYTSPHTRRRHSSQSQTWKPQILQIYFSFREHQLALPLVSSFGTGLLSSGLCQKHGVRDTATNTDELKQRIRERMKSYNALWHPCQLNSWSVLNK